jgi:hypothetical protein
MNNNIKTFLIVSFRLIIVFIFFLIDKTYQKAQSAESIAKETQNQMTSINTKLDSITEYFKITPKQQIINSIRINKVYPTSTIVKEIPIIKEVSIIKEIPIIKEVIKVVEQPTQKRITMNEETKPQPIETVVPVVQQQVNNEITVKKVESVPRGILPSVKAS